MERALTWVVVSVALLACSGDKEPATEKTPTESAAAALDASAAADDTAVRVRRFTGAVAAGEQALVLGGGSAYVVPTVSEQHRGGIERRVEVVDVSGASSRTFSIRREQADPLAELREFVSTRNPLPLSRTEWPAAQGQLTIGELDATLSWQDGRLVQVSALGPIELLRAPPKPRYVARPAAVYSDALGRRVIVELVYDPGELFAAGFERYSKPFVVKLEH